MNEGDLFIYSILLFHGYQEMMVRTRVSPASVDVLTSPEK